MTVIKSHNTLYNKVELIKAFNSHYMVNYFINDFRSSKKYNDYTEALRAYNMALNVIRQG